jgi:hypothetical protein
MILKAPGDKMKTDVGDGRRLAPLYPACERVAVGVSTPLGAGFCDLARTRI